MSLISIATVFLRWLLYSVDGSYLSTCFKRIPNALVMCTLRNEGTLAGLSCFPSMVCPQLMILSWEIPLKMPACSSSRNRSCFCCSGIFLQTSPWLSPSCPSDLCCNWHLLTRRSPIMPEPWNCNIPTSKADLCFSLTSHSLPSNALYHLFIFLFHRLKCKFYKARDFFFFLFWSLLYPFPAPQCLT